MLNMPKADHLKVNDLMSCSTAKPIPSVKIPSVSCPGHAQILTA